MSFLFDDTVAAVGLARVAAEASTVSTPRFMALPGEAAGTEPVVADPGGRAPEIDAIRGWAALSVVCFHVFWETFGGVVPWLRNPYTAFLLAGRFDVILFFVLSGDALSLPFLRGGGLRYLRRAALKRYPRLTLPIVAVTAVTALAMSAGLAPTIAAGAIVDRADWLGTYALFDPSVASAAQFAAFGVYAGGERADYLPFLWTMPVELLGSSMLLPLLALYPRVRGATLIVAGLAVALLGTGNYAGCFLLGLLLGQARADGVYASLPAAFSRVLAPAGIVASLVLVGRQQVIGDQNPLTLAAIAALLLFCLYGCGPVVRWLSRDRFSAMLGRISYLLYLWHFVVLITLTSGLVVAAAGREGTIPPVPALAIGGLTVAVSLAVSWSTLFIEGWTRSFNAMLLRLVWKD